MSRRFSTDKEREVHQEAVKLRKMTDDQLTGIIKEHYMKGFNEGNTYKIKEIEKIREKISCIKGIGAKTQSKINQVFEEILCDI